MTIEEAIRNRERCLQYLEDCGPMATPENVEAVRLSIAALRAQRELEKMARGLVVRSGRFIGQTSGGFTTGHKYEIQLTWASGYFWIRTPDGRGCCPYTSIEALAKNWEIPAK